MSRRAIPCFGLAVSLALHAVVLTLATRHLVTALDTPAPAADELPVIQMTLMPRVLVAARIHNRPSSQSARFPAQIHCH